MVLLGEKNQIIGAEHWSAIRIYKYPTKLPAIPEGFELVCGLDQGAGERIFICETLRDMKSLYHEYITTKAVSISWYAKPKK